MQSTPRACKPECDSSDHTGGTLHHRLWNTKLTNVSQDVSNLTKPGEKRWSFTVQHDINTSDCPAPVTPNGGERKDNKEAI